MSEAVLPQPPSPAEIRAELEAMVVGKLLGPAGGVDEELTERTVRGRYIVGVQSILVYEGSEIWGAVNSIGPELDN